jgi:hypothetical protein
MVHALQAGSGLMVGAARIMTVPGSLLESMIIDAEAFCGKVLQQNAY